MRPSAARSGVTATEVTSQAPVAAAGDRSFVGVLHDRHGDPQPLRQSARHVDPGPPQLAGGRVARVASDGFAVTATRSAPVGARSTACAPTVPGAPVSASANSSAPRAPPFSSPSPPPLPMGAVTPPTVGAVYAGSDGLATLPPGHPLAELRRPRRGRWPRAQPPAGHAGRVPAGGQREGELGDAPAEGETAYLPVVVVSAGRRLTRRRYAPPGRRRGRSPPGS